MKKSFVLFAAAALFAVHALATYWVVMKDGTRYVAKAKPTVNGNRATIVMKSGSTLVVDASQIDMAELFMKTTNGGSSGRFQMTQADAQALYAGGVPPDRVRLQDYFIHKVIY